MSISYNASCGQFKLDTKDTSYVFINRDGFLIHLYWGKKLDDRDHGYMFRHVLRAAFSPLMENGGGFLLDDVPLEYPAWGRGDMRSPAIEITNSNGYDICDLRYDSHRIVKGKPDIPGLPATYCESDDECETLIVTLKDAVSGIETDLYYCVFEDIGVITRYSCVRNNGNGAVHINALASASIDFTDSDFDVIGNFGTHCRERNIERVPLTHGGYTMDVRRGASSHVHNPFMILCEKGATEDSGTVYGEVLVYSGSFTATAHRGQYESVRMQIGLNRSEFGWKLDAGEEFYSPEAVLCCSVNGITGLSHKYHKLFRTRLCRGKYRDVRRPVLLNSWEACYFMFDCERLKKIGQACADLGFELMVIDDGWFGKRNSDNCSLGDWVVDKNKFPNGLEEISKFVNERGVKLGIWFEPEMISPDSDLYRAHPDWCIHIPDYPRSEGRHQLILNLAKDEVVDHIYDSISSVLKQCDIAYVKWDFNRNMTEIGTDTLPPDRQKETTHRYYLGLYRLLERLTSDFPDVLFESCSGGGGRFDAGMLYYMPQVWTSDNSDAIERLNIQYGTSLVYPMSAMSAHVSASPNHQTGHVTPFETRLTVALTGSFGYELDPTQLPEEQKKAVTDSIELFKKYGHMLATGDYYRLNDPHKDTYATWCTVSEDKKICILGYVNTKVRMYGNNRHIMPKGLKADAVYRDALTGEEYSGTQLMCFGVHAPETLEFRSHMWIFEEKC